MSSLFPEQRSAEFSDCRRYRYSLTRTWWPDRPAVVWVALNPSTADEHVDDATVRRMLGFSRAWDYGALVILNLFAWRSTDPAELSRVDNPVGEGNLSEEMIRTWAGRADKFIACWGVHGTLGNRSATVTARFQKLGVPLFCLGKTKDGHPKHPLRLRKDTELIPFP